MLDLFVYRMQNGTKSSYTILNLCLYLLQYIHPSDSHKLGQAELVCIDEAAAIPLPLVKNLLGPYLVFMSSTING